MPTRFPRLFASHDPVPRRVLVLAISLAFSVSAFGANLNNDRGCDISVAPAATLLLPYFEVDLEDRLGQTTLFKITNVGSIPQAARITLWTDIAYPIVSFDVYLTGYDVQGFNLYDVLMGELGSARGTGTGVSPGDFGEINPFLNDALCSELPGAIPDYLVARMQSAFTLGTLAANGQVAGCNTVGGVHENAVGYVTVDVVGNCSGNGPLDPHYFDVDIRYDNVLIGDYQQVDVKQNFAQASPMVHIRAIPEGGTPDTRAGLPARYATPLPQTFYGNLQKSVRPKADARQPLPSLFAVRWIKGGAGNFDTHFKIWRGSSQGPTSQCIDYQKNFRQKMGETVAFDEDGNAEGTTDYTCSAPSCIGPDPFVLRNTSLVSAVDSEIFPTLTGEARAGWLYMNLDSDQTDQKAQQGWVIASMRAEGRYSVDMDGMIFGNGCSAPVPDTEFNTPAGKAVIGPVPSSVR
ncbi:MAG TPA: hypothetical protein VGQ76_17690 [Thermoanaerobaculia bacterium]|jgi:hypothetical protein|nr:hypothetical protein [Thermoanaerobaculia bacterium]